MIDFLRILLAIVCLGAGMFFAALAAMTLRVMIDLIRAGPAAADEAYRAGDSLSNWWKGTHPNPTSRGIRGRYVKGLGVVMEETGSRRPTWS